MKCMSCDSEINPKWKYAIDSNICPFCGSNVMEENLKKLLSDLRFTMDNLLDYSDQLDDWLLSNYNYIRTDSENLIKYVSKDQLKNHKNDNFNSEEFIVKVKTDKGEEEVVSKKVIPEERTNEFFKRAEVIKPNADGFKSVAEKTQHIKNMVNRIKQSSGDSGSVITADMLSQVDPEAVAEMQTLISDDNNIISSALQSSDDDEEVPEIVLNMLNKNYNKTPTMTNNLDILKLQNLHNRINNSNKNFESGANRGKNGFSRV